MSEEAAPPSPFSDPASVAVVGASADPAKWGHWLARGALTGEDRRRVYLVNHRGGSVAGRIPYATLADLPEPPDLVVFSVPARVVPEIVDQALELGVRGLVGISGGLEDDYELARRVRAGGARLLGPACLGLFDADTQLELAWGRFEPGALGIVSQSGQVGLELARLAAEAGIGVSRFVSVGRQADVTLEEVVGELVDHASTRVVAIYAESFGDGRELVRTVTRLTEAGKPVVVLTVGESPAARSHTGAPASSLEVVDAACRAAGAVRVRTPAEMIDLARYLLLTVRPRGNRVAIVGDSGGQGAVAADVTARSGLRVTPLPAVLAARIEAGLPDAANAINPVDLAGGGEQDLRSYARVVRELTGSGEVDAVLLTGYFGSYGEDTPMLRETELGVVAEFGFAVHRTGIPVVVHSMSADSDAVRALRDCGVPTYHTVEAAAGALGTAASFAPPCPLPLVWGSAAPVGEGYLAARDLVASAGVRFPAGVAVTDRESLLAAAERLKPPYALKADFVAHKDDTGGVELELKDAMSAVWSLEDMVHRLGAGTYVLEEMDTRQGTVEIIIGARRDPSFGPLVVVGAGGTDAELQRDTTIELGPVDTERALTMLRRLRCYPLLDGWRGRAPLDVKALAETVAAVSSVLAGCAAVAEIELNPVRVGADGVLAVDAQLTRAGEERT
ncbi:acetate--CoA ligase family protein [Amycolatopsis magusensis]|uniref:acetate--CoA ligase family protein n=1 Tax=Amycolatopsis magusensis TaxID=882444 RepID=UPI003C2C7E0D